jgi:transposase
MFFRIAQVKRPNKTYEILQLVESERRRDKMNQPRQKLIKSFGNIEKIDEKKIEKFVISLLKCLPNLPIFTKDEIEKDEKTKRESYPLGDIAIIRYIFHQLKLDRILNEVITGRKIEYNFKEVVFRMVANRLINQGSEHKILIWQEELKGEKMEYQHYLRALDILLENKDKIEKKLYHNQLDLFSQKVDVVFYDLTSIFFTGHCDEITKYGKDKEKEVLLGLILSKNDIVLGHNVYEGNKAEVKTLSNTLEDIKYKFEIDKCIFIMDAGIISKKNLEMLNDAGYEYIVCQRNNLKEAKEIIEKIGDKKFRKLKDNLYIKGIECNGYKYVLGYNPEVYDHDMELQINEKRKLEEELKKVKKGFEDKKLDRDQVIKRIENILGKSFLSQHIGYEINEDDFKYYFKESLNEEEKFYGKFLVKTNVKELKDEDVILAYKSLNKIEQSFKIIKDFLKIKPVYHRMPKRKKAHIFVCVLAFTMEVALEKMLTGINISGKVALEYLSQVRLNELEIRKFYLKYPTGIKTIHREILKAIGIKTQQLMELV